MNKEKLRLLIGKFMDGTSTLEEERELETFFRNSGNDVDDELKPYKMMFAYFDGGMKDSSLLDDSKDVADRTDNTDKPHAGKHTDGKRPPKLSVVWRRALTAAACGALLLVAGYYAAGNGDKVVEMAKEMKKEAPALDIDVPQVIKTDSADNQKRKTDERNEPRQLKKWRYKPAPPEVYIAARQSSDVIDSVNTAARQLADNEVKKVEQEQQMMKNLIRAVNLLNSTEIAAADDEWETY